jgi:hypothetical protein
MTLADKERILDIIWRAMSAAANHDDIPMEAQLIADEAIVIIDALVVPEPADTD